MDGPDGHHPSLLNQAGKKGEGQGGYNNSRSKLRSSLLLGAEHKNLEDFRMTDHHGVGWDWTFETNKFSRLRLRHETKYAPVIIKLMPTGWI